MGAPEHIIPGSIFFRKDISRFAHFLYPTKMQLPIKQLRDFFVHPQWTEKLQWKNFRSEKLKNEIKIQTNRSFINPRFNQSTVITALNLYLIPSYTQVPFEEGY